MEEGEDLEGDAAIEGEADPTATEKKRGGRRNLNKVWDAGDTTGFPSVRFVINYTRQATATGASRKAGERSVKTSLSMKMWIRSHARCTCLDCSTLRPSLFRPPFSFKWIFLRVDGQHRTLWFATRLLHALIVSTLRVVTLDNIEQYMLIPSTNVPADRLVISQTVIHWAFSFVSAKGSSRPSNSNLDHVYNNTFAKYRDCLQLCLEAHGLLGPSENG
ncbi:uncharacterized protein V1513DRAFT_429777 [Lipomyces chichibuensis]|uniref:uncharacterized protein n=1 Tax=Lipomyces chichibuensis TaxID=1546026 RepID=UPI00334429A9